MRTDWTPVKGYEPRYEVNSEGIIRNKQTGRYNCPRPANNGYFRTAYGGSREYTHRLVAIHFVDNPGCAPEVNHINGDKSDNRKENLEWVTRQENCTHASRTNLINRESSLRKQQCRENQCIAARNARRPVYQLDGSGHILALFSSVHEASKKVNNSAQNIAATARGEEYRRTCGGYQWVYQDEYDPNKSYQLTPVQYAAKGVQQILSGVVVATFPSLREAASSLGVKRSDYIGECCRGIREHYKGFAWRFIK